MASTIRDVAARAGLSVGTVSKYINGKTVKESTRLAIEEAIKELDFHPTIFRCTYPWCSSTFILIIQPKDCVMPNHSPLPSCYLCLIPHFGGGIIRSGGNTKIIMIIDIVGTWCIGIPLCLLAAYVFKWGIVGVYTLLTTEELFRLAVSLIIFRRRKWIISLC